MMDGIPQKTFVNEVWKYTIITVQEHVLTHFQYTMYYRYSKSDLILAFIWTKCQQDMNSMDSQLPYKFTHFTKV